MSNSIQIRGRWDNKILTVRVLIRHPMETGLRFDGDTRTMVPKLDKKTRKPVAPHFIQHIVATHNGKTVLDANWGASVSADPSLAFKLKRAKKGDKIAVQWVDNRGKKGGTSYTVE